ncbi:hypothetical protein M9H77_11171 [Catharanthus roseus]|uniref:Uncharacterized protein n=1 Tax=Catharanthus roseus TaxID=4058 RepID=A0ACC0BDT9_CATRO|nr:hypothetical protein M9H77_11171 [Catharanthus roseus]
MFCSYKCEIDACYLQCRSNGNIIEIYESVGGKNLIMNRSDRVCWNTLPKPELSHNPIRHVRLNAVKVCNKDMPFRYPTIPNLLKSIRCPPNLISCHHIQPQANVQQFMFRFITQHGILLDVELASLSVRSNRSDQHPANSFASKREACLRFLYKCESVAAPHANFPEDLTSFTSGQSFGGTMLPL